MTLKFVMSKFTSNHIGDVKPNKNKHWMPNLNKLPLTIYGYEYNDRIMLMLIY